MKKLMDDSRVWWEEDGTEKILKFNPFNSPQIIARIFNDASGDWWYSSDLLRVRVEYLCKYDVLETNVKEMVCSMMKTYYMNKRNHYQELLDKCCPASILSVD